VSVTYLRDTAGTGIERNNRVVDVVVAKLGVRHNDVVAAITTNARLAMTEMI
jgi:uncharacterized phosphosugar-binding protein